MCQRITCQTCGKPSFAGCGQHVEQVLGDVPPAERCQCESRNPARRDAALPGMFRRMFRSFSEASAGRRS